MEEKKLRSYVRVDIPAVIHNMNEVKKKVAPDVKVMAVIKADAYGHGALEVGAALRNVADCFGVATIEEAVELRTAGLLLPILILGYTMHAKYADVIAWDVTQTIYNYEDARLLSAEAGRQGKTAKVHIALDTGMTRIGFPAVADSVAELQRIAALDNIYLEGLFTHMSCADSADKAYAKKQMKRFDDFLELLNAAGLEIPVKHICNSAGIMEFDDHRYNMVRAGIIIYGLYPSEEVAKERIDLKPALSWYAHVTHVKTTPAGEGVSYGATYVTERPTRIATIGLGYADGYSRALSNKGYVLIRGKRAPIIGRVCMDQFMVDVSEIDGVSVEDVVTLVGADGEQRISVEEIAALAGSFNYEFVCDISKRVPRVYA
ncbi:MAG: alanine racemase [Lachnospiraceae bacterium]|nr:alanine racemase [Lachnospiraceae bacterium]